MALQAIAEGVPVLEADRERRIVRVLGTIQFLHILDFVIMMPMGPQFMRAFGITASQFGLLVSVYTIAASIAGFLLAPTMDRFDRKRTLMVLFMGFLLGTLACAFAADYWQLFIARAVSGIFGGVLSSVSFSIIGDVIHPTRRGAATGAVMAAFSIASVAGVPFSLYLATKLDWHAPFLGIVALGIPGLLMVLRWVPSLRTHITGARPGLVEQVRMIFGEPNHRRAFALVSVMMFAGFTVIPFIAAYLVQNTGFPESQLPLMYLAGGSLTFFSSRWIGKLSDRYGAYRMFRIVALLSLAPILLVTNLPSVPVPLALVVTTLFMVLVSGRFVPAMTLVNASTVSRMRGSFLSFNSSVQNMSSGLASFAAGMILVTQDDGRLGRFGWVGALAIAATLVCIPLARRIESRS